MEEGWQEALKEAGMDVEDVMERLMQNEALLARCLGHFVKDENFAKLQKAVAEEDKETAFHAAHTLKGVCGNLSLTRLFALLDRQVQLMRSRDWDQATGMMPQIEQQYEMVIDGIETNRKKACS